MSDQIKYRDDADQFWGPPWEEENWRKSQRERKVVSPVREYQRIQVDDSGTDSYLNRILVAHPVTGLVRVEWFQSVRGQIIPVNWGQVNYTAGIPTYMPLRYLVADAQNMIVKVAVEKDFEWLLLWEHDVLAPPDAFIKLNNYMRDPQFPVVSGLYWTRGRPSEPLIFRGRGNGAYLDWEPGDLVYCDGVPTGFLLIHMGLLRLMWEESETYQIPYGNSRPTTRRIFDTPRQVWQNPVTGDMSTKTGTSDLEWCTRMMEGDYFRRAGWNDYMDSLEDERNPFVVDTSIACKHINPNGEQFP